MTNIPPTLAKVFDTQRLINETTRDGPMAKRGETYTSNTYETLDVSKVEMKTLAKQIRAMGAEVKTISDEDYDSFFYQTGQLLYSAGRGEPVDVSNAEKKAFASATEDLRGALNEVHKLRLNSILKEGHDVENLQRLVDACTSTHQHGAKRVKTGSGEPDIRPDILFRYFGTVSADEFGIISEALRRFETKVGQVPEKQYVALKNSINGAIKDVQNAVKHVADPKQQAALKSAVTKALKALEDVHRTRMDANTVPKQAEFPPTPQAGLKKP